MQALAMICAAVVLVLFPLSSSAGDEKFSLRIVLTNDDGFETENIQALFAALLEAGHEVIMSSPYVNQSGTSGALDFLDPIPPTSEPSEGGLLPAGSFGIGLTTIAPDQHYVAGKPTAAVLYGIDVLAQQKWGAKPDLVLSGPNDGNNVGRVTSASGTVGATVMALSKAIPAIALSAADDDGAEVVAALTVKLVHALTRGGHVRLPALTGLNVNFPPIDPETQSAKDFRFKLTNVGIASNIGAIFYENLGDGILAQAFGIPPDIGLPGVGIEAQDGRLGLPPVDVGHPDDDDPQSEWNALAAGDVVTVSVIQSTYEASKRQKAKVKKSLRHLLH
jgi:5'-nucleotidase